MRIAQIAPLAESVPPRLYGGTERVVSNLTEELVRLGHDVTLFASGDSRTSAKLIRCSNMALLNPSVKEPIPYHIVMLDEVRRQVDEFDVLHFHTEFFHFPLIRDVAHRTLTTLHGRLDVPDLASFYATFSEIPLASISYSQRRPIPRGLNWAGNVYHGLPRDLLPFQPKPSGSYLAFLGRISPEKRPDRAIEIASRAGLPLKIAAKIDHADQAYWSDVIAPMLRAHSNVEVIGEINEREKADLLGNAIGLLFPMDWREPFGLVMIEAMACDTPIVAFHCGSVPEVVDEGMSGFLVNGVGEAIDAVAKLETIDRLNVRSAFEQRFTAERMAQEYVAIYHRQASVDRGLPSLRFANGRTSDRVHFNDLR